VAVVSGLAHADTVRVADLSGVTGRVRLGEADRRREIAPAWLDLGEAGHALAAVGAVPKDGSGIRLRPYGDDHELADQQPSFDLDRVNLVHVRGVPIKLEVGPGALRQGDGQGVRARQGARVSRSRERSAASASALG
jgi:hypothetical protein